MIRETPKLKIFFVFVSLLLPFYFSLQGEAENVYLTFVAKDGGTSLQKSDVSLKIDNENVPVTEFFFVDIASPTPAILSHLAGRRQYIFLFDLIFNKPEDLLLARKATEIFLARVGKEDLVAIAGISRKGGLKFFANFTKDRSKWISGLNAIGNDRPVGMIEGPEGSYYPANYSPKQTTAKLIPEEQFLEQCKSFAPDEKKKEENRSSFLQGMVQLSFALSTVKGRKNLILFSPGFETKGIIVSLNPIQQPPAPSGENAAEEHETLEDITRPGGQGPAEPTPLQRRKQGGTEVIVELLEGSDCHVSVNQMAGEDNNFYKDLAVKTGGTIWKKGVDVNAVADQIVGADKSYYVVGWNGREEKSPNLPHPINLSVAGRKIAASEKWIAPRPFSLFSPLEKKIQVAKAVYSDTGSSFTKETFWLDFMFEEGICKIPVFVQIPGSEILKQGGPKLWLDFYAFAIAEDGTIQDYYADPVSVNLTDPKLKDQLTRSGIKTWNLLWANHGLTTVRWVMMNPITGETVTHTEKLNIPESELTVSNPFFPALDLDWLVWPKLHAVQKRRGFEVRYPYSLGADYFVPDLSPKISRQVKGRVFYFKIYNLLPESKNPPVLFALVNKNGKPAEISQFGLRQEPKYLDHGGMETFWRILAFPDVSPGPYRFRVDVTDTARRKEVIRESRMDLL
jgi:hypothetical protein